MLTLAAQPSVPAQADLGKARHALDIEMHQIAWNGMFVALDRRRRIEVAPSTQSRPTQHPADGGWTGTRPASDFIARHVSSAQLNNAVVKALRQAARAATRPRTAVQQTIDAAQPEPLLPLAGGLGAYAEGGRGRLPRGPPAQE